MKKIVSLIIVFACLFSVSGIGITAYAEEQKEISATLDLRAIDAKIDSMLEERDYVPGQIIFRTKKGLSRTAQTTILKSLDMVMSLEEISKKDYFENTLDGAKPYFKFDYERGYFAITVSPYLMKPVLKLLELNPAVEKVCPNYIMLSSPFPSYTQLPSDGGTSSIYDPLTSFYAMDAIGVEDAWSKGFTGSTDVKIAVIDTGYNPHEDIDCVLMSMAYNSCNHTSDVTDYLRHGTFVIGQIGACLNEVGVNGIAQNISIVPIKAYVEFIQNGVLCYATTQTAFADALEYAEDNGIDVVNISSEFTVAAMETIYDIFGGLVVLSAGNSWSDVETLDENAVGSGTKNDEPNFLFVGASNAYDEVGSWSYVKDGETILEGSNYSEYYVDLFAPGVNIASVGNLGNDYLAASGTSMAAPYVAASAAVIMSHATQYRDDPEGLIELLCSTVDQRSWLHNKCVSGGRLSLINAVEYLYTCERPGEYSRGDVDNDGYVTAVDATLVRGYVMNTTTLSDLQLSAADIDGNGIVNIADYVLVQKFVNQTNYFPPS